MSARRDISSYVSDALYNVVLLCPGPPDALRNCTLTNRTQDSLRVACVPGFDGGLRQTFFMEVRLRQPLLLIR